MFLACFESNFLVNSSKTQAMGPRRQRIRERTPSPIPEPLIEPDEDYPNIVFRDQDQRYKFQNLKEQPIIPTRFTWANVLRNLSLFEYAMHFFRAIGMGFMFNMNRETYPELVFEFSSYLTIAQDDYGEITFYFRIDGIEQHLSVTELANLFGLTETERNWIMGSTLPNLAIYFKRTLDQPSELNSEKGSSPCH